MASSPHIPRVNRQSSLSGQKTKVEGTISPTVKSPGATVECANSEARAIKDAFQALESEIKASHKSSLTTAEKSESVSMFPPSPPGVPRRLSSGGVKEGALMLGTHPVRQESLGDFGVSLLRTKTSSGSQNLFHDVLEQLTTQEEALPRQTSLYTLPSMTFLESLLDEMDSRNTSQGVTPPEPPIYLPIDSFDLPGLDDPGNMIENIEQLGLEPLDCSPSKSVHSCPVNASGGMVTNHVSKYCGIPPASPFRETAIAPTAGSAAPSPQKEQAMNRKRSSSLRYCHSAYDYACAEVDDEDDENDLDYVETLAAFQHSKMKKTSAATIGQKRKHSTDLMTYVTAPAEFGRRRFSGTSSQGGRGSEADVGEEVSGVLPKKPQKSRKGKPTVCLNCGSTDTPQWRCGPLGPRTLCNACGVRYKKGLPLVCWPLRNGMVLPPGAELPPSVVVPEGMTIVTQPSRSL